MFLAFGFTGRILEGIGAGLLQTSAYGEAIAQNRAEQNKIVGYLETSAVVGNMSGLFVAAFLSHFLGFIGPFAFIGTLSILLAIFMTKLVDFVKVTPQNDD